MGLRCHSMVAFAGLAALLQGCTSQQSALAVRPVGSPNMDGSTDERFQRARFMLSANQPGLAIGLLREILRDTPDDAAALNCLGIAYDDLGRTDLARRYFEQAMAKAPLDRRYANNLARLMGEAPAQQVRLADTAGDARSDALSGPIQVSPATGDSAEDTTKLSPSLINTEAKPVTALSSVDGSTRVAPQESLSRRGIFSLSMTAFVPAAGLAKPRRLPVTPVTKEAAQLPVRVSADSRIERISLGEVRLVTTSVTRAPTTGARAHVGRKARNYWTGLETRLRLAALLENERAERRANRMASIEQAVALIRADAGADTSLATLGSESNPS